MMECSKGTYSDINKNSFSEFEFNIDLKNLSKLAVDQNYNVLDF